MRRGLVIGILFAVLVGAGFFYLGYKPVAENIAVLEVEVLAAEAENATLVQERNRLTRIEDAQFEYRAAVGLLETFIPTSPQQSELINGLKALAVDSSVLWSGVSFGAPADTDDGVYSEVRFGLQIEGNYFELLGYLHSMEEMDRVIRIESASFSPSVGENGLVTLTASINATAFTTGDVSLVVVTDEEEAAAEEPATEDQ
jgi:Tfp pilus assembly protein PilO